MKGGRETGRQGDRQAGRERGGGEREGERGEGKKYGVGGGAECTMDVSEGCGVAGASD